MSFHTGPLAMQIDSELTEYFFLKGTSNMNSMQEVIVPGVDDNSWEVELKFLVENDPTPSISTSSPQLCRQSQSQCGL